MMNAVIKSSYDVKDIKSYDVKDIKSSYDVKDIDVTKHVVAMVVTESKTSKSYAINPFHFQRSNFTFL